MIPLDLRATSGWLRHIMLINVFNPYPALDLEEDIVMQCVVLNVGLVWTQDTQCAVL